MKKCKSHVFAVIISQMDVVYQVILFLLTAIEFINDIFNPEEKIEKRLEAMEHSINQKLDSISKCNHLQDD